MELPGDPHSLCLRADTGSRLSPILNCFLPSPLREKAFESVTPL